MVSEREYETQALYDLRTVLASMDEVGEEIDAELTDDRLILEFPDGSEGVLNLHRAARQLWLAMDRSAWHFDWEPQRTAWVSQRTGEELWSTLERLVSEKLGRPLQLGRGARPR